MRTLALCLLSIVCLSSVGCAEQSAIAWDDTQYVGSYVGSGEQSQPKGEQEASPVYQEVTYQRVCNADGTACRLVPVQDAISSQPTASRQRTVYRSSSAGTFGSRLRGFFQRVRGRFCRGC